MAFLLSVHIGMKRDNSGQAGRPVYVAVDVGRSSLKFRCTYHPRHGSPFTYSMQVPTAVLEDTSGQFVLSDGLSYVKLSAPAQGSYLVGDPAVDTHSSDLIDFGESDSFHRYSLVFILWAVARSVLAVQEAVRETPSSVELALALTGSNLDRKGWYAVQLVRQHNVSLFPDGVPVRLSFRIKEVYAFLQGYASCLTSLKSKGDLTSGRRLLVVDVGRYTVDLCLVSSCTLSSHTTLNLGTNELLPSVISKLRESGVTADKLAVERALVSGDALRSLTSDPVDVRGIALSVAQPYFDRIGRHVVNFVAGAPLDGILLCGGGSRILESLFRESYHVPVTVPDSPVFANVEGMASFLDMVEVR